MYHLKVLDNQIKNLFFSTSDNRRDMWCRKKEICFNMYIDRSVNQRKKSVNRTSYIVPREFSKKAKTKSKTPNISLLKDKWKRDIDIDLYSLDQYLVRPKKKKVSRIGSFCRYALLIAVLCSQPLTKK